MSTFSVSRSANGQIVLSLQNLDNYNVNGLGKMSGDVKLSVGQTNATTDQTVLQIGQSEDAGSLVFEATDSSNNLEFYGKNIDASVKNDSGSPYNISWKASNSTFDSTKANASVVFESDKNSSNNLVKLGSGNNKFLNKYDNLIFDNGKNNIYVAADSSTTRVETSETSKGVVVDAGNGANDFLIAGDLGTFIGGKGKDTYITDQKTANKNMMIGKEGADVLHDYGQNSLFIGGKYGDVDEAYLYGKQGIANLGFDEVGKFNFENGSYESSVFTGATQTDANGKVYSYKDILKLRGWTIGQYLAESNINSNPYYNSLIKKEIEESLG